MRRTVGAAVAVLEPSTPVRQFWSHELRIPLTIVGGYIKRSIRTGTDLEALQLKGLQTAEQETQRMRHLLNDLLDLSRGDSGRLSVSQQPVALLPFLEQVQELAQPCIGIGIGIGSVFTPHLLSVVMMRILLPFGCTAMMPRSSRVSRRPIYSLRQRVD